MSKEGGVRVRQRLSLMKLGKDPLVFGSHYYGTCSNSDIGWSCIHTYIHYMYLPNHQVIATIWQAIIGGGRFNQGAREKFPVFVNPGPHLF